MTGSSTQGIKTVLHPVSDLATAKVVHVALLRVQPQVDDSYYVDFEAATASEPRVGRAGAFGEPAPRGGEL